MHTSFEDNSVLGKFNNDCAAIDKALDQAAGRSAELKAAYQEIEKLKADLLECREFIDPYVDVNDGDDGPVPNKAMRLVSMIDESIHGPGNF